MTLRCFNWATNSVRQGQQTHDSEEVIFQSVAWTTCCHYNSWSFSSKVFTIPARDVNRWIIYENGARVHITSSSTSMSWCCGCDQRSQTCGKVSSLAYRLPDLIRSACSAVDISFKHHTTTLWRIFSQFSCSHTTAHTLKLMSTEFNLPQLTTLCITRFWISLTKKKGHVIMCVKRNEDIWF